MGNTVSEGSRQTEDREWVISEGGREEEDRDRVISEGSRQKEEDLEWVITNK